MKKIIQLALIDFKLIFRDPSLRIFLFFPIILIALFTWTLPSLVEKYDFLLSYVPLFMVVAVIENTQMFCFISCMALIDIKETEVVKVYGILPFTKYQYIVSRFLIPYFFYCVIEHNSFFGSTFFTIRGGDIIILSLLTALIVPVYALAINAIVKNRSKGWFTLKHSI